MKKYNPKRDMQLSEEAISLLRRYEWPGNVRQLENVIERMTITTNSKLIGRECIPAEILESLGEAPNKAEDEKLSESEDMRLDEVSRRHVLRTVAKYGNNVKKAAEVLGISRMTVYKYLNADN